MKGVIGLLMISLLLLGACDVEREPPRPGPYGEIESEIDNLRLRTKQSETLIFML